MVQTADLGTPGLRFPHVPRIAVPPGRARSHSRGSSPPGVLKESEGIGWFEGLGFNMGKTWLNKVKHGQTSLNKVKAWSNKVKQGQTRLNIDSIYFSSHNVTYLS